MVGNSALQGLTGSATGESATSPTTGRVIGVILIASGFTLTGLAFMDPLFGIPPPSWKTNKDTGFADLVMSLRELFYHDLTEEDAEYWASCLGSQNLKAMFEGGEHAYAGWMDVPVWYIGTIEDRGLPVMLQRMQVGMARGMGGSVVHRELQSSHSPFLSMPAECVEIIKEASGAFTGKKIHEVSIRETALVKGRKEIHAPAIRLLQPWSWLQYGLPLGLGRI